MKCSKITWSESRGTREVRWAGFHGEVDGFGESPAFWIRAKLRTDGAYDKGKRGWGLDLGSGKMHDVALKEILRIVAPELHLAVAEQHTTYLVELTGRIHRAVALGQGEAAKGVGPDPALLLDLVRLRREAWECAAAVGVPAEASAHLQEVLDGTTYGG